MRGGHVGALVILALVTGHHTYAAQEASGAAKGSVAATDEAARTTLTEGQDAYFVSNHLSGMSLLHLRQDGTYASYAREHMFVGLDDEGRWKTAESGDVLLCSHFRFRPLEAGPFTVFPRARDVSGLPALLAAIERRLSASPDKWLFSPDDLKPVVARSSGAKDAFAPVPSGALSPVLYYDAKPLLRGDLEKLMRTLRDYVGQRNGNLTWYVATRYRDLIWLSDPAQMSGDGEPEQGLLDAYRKHKEGPFLPDFVTVAVDAATFAGLVGTRQSFVHYPKMNDVVPRHGLLGDLRGEPIEAPFCGRFVEGGAALPEPPKPVPARLPAGEAMAFAMDTPPDSELLLLDADGRFRRYYRDVKEVTLLDRGEWRQEAGGAMRLCSRAAFRSVGAGRLGLWVDEASYAQLPALLASVRALLAAEPAKPSFASKQIEGIARRTLPEAKGHTRWVSGKEPITHGELEAFVQALDEYLRSDTANLTELAARSYGATTWLDDPADSQSAAVLRTLRALGDSHGQLALVFVRTPVPDSIGAREPAPADGLKNLAAPHCSGFGKAPGNGAP